MPIKRVNYSTGQLLTAEDFQAEQTYHRDMRRRINGALITPGVASGLTWSVSSQNPMVATLSKGVAIDGNGCELVLTDPLTVDFANAAVLVKPSVAAIDYSRDSFLVSLSYSDATDDPADKRSILGVDTAIRKTEQPVLLLTKLAADGSPPASADGLNIRLGTISFPEVQPVTNPPANAPRKVNPSTQYRQIAGSHADPNLPSLKVAGDAAIGGAMNVTGLSAFTGDASFNSNLKVQTPVANGKTETLVISAVATDGPLAPSQFYYPRLKINGPSGSAGLTIGADYKQSLTLSYYTDFGGYGALSVGSSDTPRHLCLQPFDGGNVSIGNNAAPKEKLHVLGSYILVAGAGNENAYLGGDNGAYSPGPVSPGSSTPAPAKLDVQLGSTNPVVSTVSLYNRSGAGSFMDLACHYMYGTKVGYVVDQFVNASGDRLDIGDVVVIGSNQATLVYGSHGVPVPEVDLTTTAYDTRVCGIVSDTSSRNPNSMKSAADGGKPSRSRSKKAASASSHAHAAQSLPAEDRDQMATGQIGHMATLGAFAHCKVDADIASIEIGDLLTTSPTPGHAQKVLDRSQAIGAIIGKALAPLKKGQGKIPVMVMMQ